MASSAAVYRARWVISNREGPIEDGAVVCADGRIARVGRWSRLQPHVGLKDGVKHFDDSALLPGLVNGHTHLSLSDMKGRLRPTKHFAAWIGRLTARRLARTKGAIRRAVRQGTEESLAAGTVAGADVTTEPAFDDALAGGPLRWRVFGEVLRFGEAGRKFTEERIADLEALKAQTGLEVGLAPHAPYTLGIEDFMRARREADARGWPVSAHLHETLDEIEFTRSGQGDLHKWLSLVRFLPKDLAPLGKRPIPALAEAGFFTGPVLVAHGNYLTDEEIWILARSGSSVAYCPRSHAFFGHADHPWRRLLAAGANVCLGTDSLASSPSLSILDEMRYVAAREADAEPRLLLEMATVRGARALGFADDLGDLAEGLRADFCVVGPVAPGKEPLAAILAGEGNISRVVLGGQARPGTCPQ
ncbi:MAG: amidohydrolase family protein [Planctomycetota bacterium]|nr:amidohydrolase family protein [Planctomycetota bacterium]